MKHFWKGIAALLVLAPGLGVAQPERSVPNDACRVPQKPVDESGLVEIGGIQQWVVIEGQDCGNPVILIVHGGPGNSNTPFAHSLFGSWTRNFTVVQWDQRGSGKTYAASKPDESDVLTMERLTKDGIMRRSDWANARSS